jgi:hypothetical protein
MIQRAIVFVILFVLGLLMFGRRREGPDDPYFAGQDVPFTPLRRYAPNGERFTDADLSQRPDGRYGVTLAISTASGQTVSISVSGLARGTTLDYLNHAALYIDLVPETRERPDGDYIDNDENRERLTPGDILVEFDLPRQTAYNRYTLYYAVSDISPFGVPGATTFSAQVTSTVNYQAKSAQSAWSQIYVSGGKGTLSMWRTVGGYSNASSASAGRWSLKLSNSVAPSTTTYDARVVKDPSSSSYSMYGGWSAG